MQGDLSHETLAEIIRKLYVGRRSGILHLAEDSVSKRIYFRKGSMIFANSDVDKDRLGEFLIRRGVIDREAFEKASGAMRETGSRFGRTVVELGYATDEEMEAKVVEQIQTIIYSLFGWESGTYRFEQHESPVDEDIMLNLSTADIILEGTRRMEDMGRIRSALGGAESMLQTTVDPLLLYQKMSTLSQSEYFILSRVDGSSSLAEILSISPIGEDAALRCIYGLVSAGVLELSHSEEAAKTTVPAEVCVPEASSSETPESDPRERVRSVPLPPERVAIPAPSGPARATVPPPEPPEPLFEPPSEPHGPSPEEVAVRDDIIEKHASLSEGSAYDLLGIAITANDAEIKKAYYAMAKKYHPDRHHSPHLTEVHGLLEELFGKITYAYQLLTNPLERNRYDAKLRAAGGAEVPEEDPERASASKAARKRAADEHYREGKRHFDEMHYFDAIQCLREAVRLFPTKAYHKLLAQALMKNPKWSKEAEEQFNLALKLDPFDADCYVGLGEVYEAAGMTTRAQKMYEQASTYDPENVDARKKIGSKSGASGLGGIKKIFRRKKG